MIRSKLVARLATDTHIPTFESLGSRVRDVATPPLSNPKCWEGICRQGYLSGGELRGGSFPRSGEPCIYPFFNFNISWRKRYSKYCSITFSFLFIVLYLFLNITIYYY
ncbi:hypothetical protein Hanom_Chr01g00034101 [Helianthus anomalus]